MKTTPKYLNVVPHSVLLGLKIESAIADMNIIARFIEEGAVAADDLPKMLEIADNMAASANELRVGMEISADARSVTDDEFERLIDEDVETEDD